MAFRTLLNTVGGANVNLVTYCSKHIVVFRFSPDAAFLGGKVP